MKSIAVLIAVGVIVIGLMYKQGALTFEEEVINQITTEEVDEIEIDEIDRARQELERINVELDEKEQELIKQREAIDSEIERVRETRLSFQ